MPDKYGCKECGFHTDSFVEIKQHRDSYPSHMTFHRYFGEKRYNK